MARPLVGISTVSSPDPGCKRTGGKLSLNWNYAEMIADLGGCPVLIPPQAEPESIVGILDGFLIPGGNDISPALYKASQHNKCVLEDVKRAEWELRLLSLTPNDLPILGICYGCQLINVWRGGSLEQHVPDRVGNENHSSGNLETYSIRPSTLLHTLLGESTSGQSWHHQAIATVGSGLRVSALAPDSTIEAVEASDRMWTIGVQWHPERTPSNPATQDLLRSFIDAANQYGLKRRLAVPT